MPGQRGNAGTWSGRLAVPLMLWYGGFSSLGVSLAYHFDRHSLSRSWSIQAGSAPTAEGPEVLVSWWWTGGAAAVEAFLVRRGPDMDRSSGSPSDALAWRLLVGCVFGI